MMTASTCLCGNRLIWQSEQQEGMCSSCLWKRNEHGALADRIRREAIQRANEGDRRKRAARGQL